MKLFRIFKYCFIFGILMFFTSCRESIQQKISYDTENEYYIVNTYFTENALKSDGSRWDIIYDSKVSATSENISEVRSSEMTKAEKILAEMRGDKPKEKPVERGRR